jgi:Protein of unknown function (DUF3995)
VSFFWTAGGTWLLDTVGGAFEDLARDRTAAAIALGVVVVVVKVTAGFLALGLARSRGSRRVRRLLLGVNATAALVLILWGGINVVVGALVLTDVIAPGDDVDEHALRWHVFLWDSWFLVWGLALALATVRFRRHMQDPR